MNTKQLRQKILDLAIRGQLVPQDSNDEPASVLLEKIRTEKQTLIEQKKIKKDKKSSYITCDLSPYQKYTEHFADGSSKNITDEIPFEIPENWAWCRLGEVCEIIMGQSPKSENISKKGKLEFHQGKIFFTSKYIKSSESYTNEITKIAPKNSVLICVRAPVGEVNITNRELCIGRGLCSIVPLQKMSEIFVYYWTKILKEKFIQKATGSTFASISMDIIRNEIIPLPPLSEQRRIVEKIEELLALVDDLETNKIDLQSYIKQAKSKVLEMAIRGELVPQNPEDEPVSVLLERIKKEQKSSKSKGKTTAHNTHYEEELPFDIPENWVWCRLGEIGEIISGGTPSTSNDNYWNGNISWITPADLSNYKEKYISRGKRNISIEGLENSSAKIICKGSVLFSSRAPIGYVVISEKEVTTNQGFKSISPYIENSEHYIYYFLLAEKENISLKASGTTFKELSGTEFGKIFIPLPPLAEQYRIVEKIAHIFAVLEELEENIL